jgi:hypothetical protein
VTPPIAVSSQIGDQTQWLKDVLVTSEYEEADDALVRRRALFCRRFKTGSKKKAASAELRQRAAPHDDAPDRRRRRRHAEAWTSTSLRADFDPNALKDIYDSSCFLASSAKYQHLMALTPTPRPRLARGAAHAGRRLVRPAVGVKVVLTPPCTKSPSE